MQGTGGYCTPLVQQGTLKKRWMMLVSLEIILKKNKKPYVAGQ